jgi:hypothetical protein
MKIKALSFLLLLSLITPLNFAHAGQVQDDLEALSTKFTSIFKESSSLLESLEDLELNVQIATDSSDTNELKKLIVSIVELPPKLEAIDKTTPPLKKSLDENCAKARLDKSESSEAADTLVSCVDAESIYNAHANTSKLFAQSQKNIETNLAKFGLSLVKATPTPSPSATAKAPDVVKPSPVATVKTTAAKKITITCVKKKLIKKVTAVKPKCPAGYKKK